MFEERLKRNYWSLNFPICTREEIMWPNNASTLHLSRNHGCGGRIIKREKVVSDEVLDLEGDPFARITTTKRPLLNKEGRIIGWVTEGGVLTTPPERKDVMVTGMGSR